MNSDLRSCRRCETPVSPEAVICPKCGEPWPGRSIQQLQAAAREQMAGAVGKIIFGLLTFGVGYALLEFGCALGK